jgi:heptosyltransferase-1
MGSRVLLVRLGAMGDVLHAIPVAMALARAGHRVAWVVEPRWMPLLEGNPALQTVIPLDRRQWTSIREARRQMREFAPEWAVDVQGLIKSALVARFSGARRITGFDTADLREPLARWAYHERRRTTAAHVVDRNLELAGCPGPAEWWLPPGVREGELPEDPFVLASPFAGWTAKEWPLEYWTELARMLPVPLVLNGAPRDVAQLRALPGVQVHVSSIAGLIDATRRAAMVIGLDSGPLHLAAALRRPGVALFGPTDPARNGPYGGTIHVLRQDGAATTYRRDAAHAESLRALTPQSVRQALVQHGLLP